MPMLRNTTTGVVVNVDDETAARLVGQWEPVAQEKPARKRSSRKGDSDE